jgi:hypothetical protein
MRERKCIKFIEECHLLGCHHVVLVGNDVSEECIASAFRMKTTNKVKTC